MWWWMVLCGIRTEISSLRPALGDSCTIVLGSVGTVSLRPAVVIRAMRTLSILVYKSWHKGGRKGGFMSKWEIYKGILLSFGPPLNLRNEGVHLLPWEFGRVVEDVCSQLDWPRDWFWRPGFIFCTVLYYDMGVNKYKGMVIFLMKASANKIRIVFSVDKINRGSTKKEKFRPWKQNFTINPTVIKAKKKKNTNFPKPIKYIEIVANMQEWKTKSVQRNKKPRPSNKSSCQSSYFCNSTGEALGRCCCPCHPGSLPPVLTMRALCEI